MKLPRFLALFVFIGLVPFASAADANPIFGPYEAIVYDQTMLQGVKVDDVGDVFLMFQPDKTDTQLTIRISMAEGSQYRKWFTGDEVLVAQENAGRAPNSWTDRVQTTANYIEYIADGRIFLHLKKIEG
ncbi:MAG: hypothetical protein K9M98_02545 [Cephaloticoccus sp.]|nr:hypothetical protein [Cephaloticoccus sp.]MCF7759360.1 hypothetical protein [Cephaloticoccus sp.]